MKFFKSFAAGAVITGSLALFISHTKFAFNSPPALQAFINANVLTMNSDRPQAEAILIERHKIISVGSNTDITKLVRSHKDRYKVRVHDLSGKTVVPGFVDAHSHFPKSGVYEFAANLNAPPIGEVSNIDMLQTVLRNKVANSDEEWVLGIGYDDLVMRENRHPFKEELDAVTTQKPLFILHVSGHIGVANSIALNRLGISAESKPPIGGEYVKNEKGQLTGLLVEKAAFEALKQAAKYTKSQQSEILRAAIVEYASQGETTVHNGATDLSVAKLLLHKHRTNKIPQRLIIWPLSDDFENISKQLTVSDELSNRFKVGAAKIIADGSIQAYTAYLTEPYLVNSNSQIGARGRAYRGSPLIPQGELLKLIDWYFSKNQQVAIHSNGDGSIDDVLRAIEYAVKRNPDYEHRTILVHAQMARDDQLKKMKELGVSPSFFGAHTFYWGDRHRDVFLGTRRAGRISPMLSAIRYDLAPSIHMNSPVVPINTMRFLNSVVSRKTSDGRLLGGRERVSRIEALKAITINAAKQNFLDEELGSIEAGKLADFVVLDKDPTQKNHELMSIEVEQTYVGGVQIFRSEHGLAH